MTRRGAAPRAALALAAAAALLLAACAGGPPAGPAAAPGAAPGATPAAAGERAATIQRTASGVAHVSAPDFEALAYGMAYAYAEDNVCLTAQHLVTVRGERARTFGAAGSGLLGLRRLPNEIIDLFIAAHMDDAALA
ncbi:MAG: penicillin acylase family protein, partial [Burkholderiaceae bacterium]|nr:penicillin acylase family protein [Burkholderiaceae bacterium]